MLSVGVIYKQLAYPVTGHTLGNRPAIRTTGRGASNIKFIDLWYEIVRFSPVGAKNA